MMNRYLRNTALSLAVVATPTLALAAGVPHGYPGMGASPSSYRPDSAGYQHERGGLMRGAGGGAATMAARRARRRASSAWVASSSVRARRTSRASGRAVRWRWAKRRRARSSRGR